jgi:hypothetical protein
VDAIVRNSGGREHPLPRRVHDDVPGGEVDQETMEGAPIFPNPQAGPNEEYQRTIREYYGYV